MNYKQLHGALPDTHSMVHSAERGKMKIKAKVDKTEWGTVKTFSNEDNTIRFALYTYNDDNETIYLSNLFVDESLRKHGYGDRIIEWVFDYAKSRSFKAIILNVVKNSWVEKWYERKGFEYLEDCEDDEYKGNVWLKKDLDQGALHYRQQG